MPARVYSTRFIHTDTGLVWVGTTVPVGYRAVLKNVAGSSYAGGAVSAHIEVAGIHPFIHTFPGSYSSWSIDCMVVAYQGNYIGAYMNGTGAAITISGYLFDDSGELADVRLDGEPDPDRPPPPPFIPWDVDGR